MCDTGVQSAWQENRTSGEHDAAFRRQIRLSYDASPYDV